MGGRSGNGLRNSTPQRPQTRADYKLTSEDVKTLRILFENHDSGTGAQIAKKLAKAENEGRTNVYLTFLEKDFAFYKLEGMLTEKEAISLEKIMKPEAKESFDMYWEERRKK